MNKQLGYRVSSFGKELKSKVAETTFVEAVVFVALLLTAVKLVYLEYRTIKYEENPTREVTVTYIHPISPDVIVLADDGKLWTARVGADRFRPSGPTFTMDLGKPDFFSYRPYSNVKEVRTSPTYVVLSFIDIFVYFLLLFVVCKAILKLVEKTH